MVIATGYPVMMIVVVVMTGERQTDVSIVFALRDINLSCFIVIVQQRKGRTVKKKSILWKIF